MGPECSINGNMQRRAEMHSATMAWQPSPSGTVWRKRLHLVGPAEAGQVTSVVRYDPNAQFPAHDHPQGEEILVLGGVFSDEHGHWPIGTYLLHPEGFRHAPFSQEGCVLFVKLRQYAGTQRHYVVVETDSVSWEQGPVEGVEEKVLYGDVGYPDSMSLERWGPGTDLGVQRYANGMEIFVLHGGFEDEEGNYEPGAWLRLPPSGEHHPRSPTGCELYIKRDGVGSLHSDPG